MREQNVQVSAGQVGAEPMPNSDFLSLINAQGRLTTVEEFGNIVLKTGDNGQIVKLSDVARSNSARATTRCAPSWTRTAPSWAWASSRHRGPTRWTSVTR